MTITNTTSGFTRNLSVTLALTTPTAFGHNATLLPGDNTSVNARAPSTRYNFARAVYLVPASELAANGFTNNTVPKAIGWTYQTAPGVAGSAPLTIYMQNTADTTNTKSTTWATAISGMTTVHSATTALPSTVGAFDILFSRGSAFTYTGGGLYIAFDWGQYAGTLSTTTVVSCNSQGLANGLLGGQGASAPTTISVSSFRPETRLGVPYTPTVTTPSNASITATTATLGGNLTRDWGATVTARGVVYALTSVNASPVIGGTGVTNVIDASTTTGVFTENITGLTPGAAYSFAAYATNSIGTSYTTPVSAFSTLSAAPTVTAITPNGGPIAGGQSVTITGTNFTGTTGVTIGGTAATGVTVVNATTITATTPAQAAGTASVVVTTPGGSNPFNLLYTYLTPQEAWRLQFFGITTNTGKAADTADPDGDGNDNRFEYAAGLIPTDPNSRFKVRVEKVVGQPTQRAIIFSPLVLTAGRTYAVTF